MSFNSEYQELRKKRKKKETENQTTVKNVNPLSVTVPNNTIPNTDIAPVKTAIHEILTPTISSGATNYSMRNTQRYNNAVKSNAEVKTTTTFEDNLMKKYSTMSLEDIENEYKRVEAEEKTFKDKNGGKTMNILAKFGSYIVGEDTKGIKGSEIRNDVQSNLNKLNELTKEKEIINTYRKQKATEKYIGNLTEEQIKLVDEIVTKGEVDNYYKIAPVFSPESAGITANESAKNREQITNLKKELAGQLQELYTDKNADEINELVDNIVELRRNQLNAQQQEKDNAEMKAFASEHELPAFLLSRGANVIGGFTGVFEPILQAGNEYGIDTNSAGFSLTKASNTIDEQIQLDHDWTIDIGGTEFDGFDLMYAAGTAIVDNVARLALSGGNTTVAQGIELSQVATQSIIDCKEKGYSDAKALTIALITATFEAVTGKISLDNILKSNGNIITKSILPEGTQEVATNWLNNIADQIANGNQSEMSRQYTIYLENGYTEAEALAEVVTSSIGEDFESFLIGALTGGILGGGAALMNKASKNAFTETEQKVIDKEVENRIAEKEKDGNTVTSKEKSQIRKSVINDLEKGYISIDTIEEVLGGDNYKNYKEAVDNEKALQDEFDNLNQMKQGEMTGEQIDRRAELKQQLEDLKNNSNTSQLKQQLSDDVFGIAKDSRLVESYNEKTRRGQIFEADLSKYDAKQQEVVKKAAESGILNNTNRTHEFVDMLARISADKGVSFDFTNNEKLKNSSFAVEGTTVNGYVTSDGITLNIDSAKSLNSVVGHEITHILEGTDLYSTLQQTIVEYAKSKGDYQGRYDTLSKLYEGVEDANIDNELTADLVGDYLFTDSEFINSLSTEQPNLFKRIYNEIKYLYKVASAGSKEARELEKVKRAFEKAYKESATAQKNTTDKGDVKYSLNKYNEHQIENWKNSKRIVIYNNNEQLIQFIQDSVDGKNVDKKMYFGTISSDLAKTIQEETGLNVEKYNLSLGSFEIRKILKAHGDVNKETSRGQRAVTVDDFAHIVDVVLNPKIIELSEDTYMGKPVIVFKGEYNGRMNVTAVVSDKRLDLFVQTVFVNVKKRNLSTPIGEQAPINTPEANNGTVSDNSVSNSNKNVNTKSSKTVTDYSLDSEGNELSKEQQEYFKDSKVRDEDGNLIVVYHGTSEDFNVFDREKGRSNMDIQGSFFSPWKLDASGYGSNVRAFYLNITNPASEAVGYKALRKFQGQNNAGVKAREYLENLGYDGVNNGNEEYIAFYSNQIKEIDNKTPTDSEDIRYSYSKEGQKPKEYGDFNIYGQDIKYQGTEDVAPVKDNVFEQETVAPLQTVNNEQTENLYPEDYAPLTEEQATEMFKNDRERFNMLDDTDAPIIRDTEHYNLEDDIAIDEKSIVQLTKTISDSLSLSRTNRNELGNVIRDFVDGKYSSKEALRNAMEKRFGTIYTEERNELISEVKSVIRNTKIRVTDYEKSEFGSPKDYKQWLQNNFGKIRIANDGIGVDQFYQELTETYGESLFPSDIWNSADQLKQISEIANKPIKDLIPEEMPSEMIDEATDRIVESINEYKRTERLNVAYELFKEANEHFFDNVEPINESTIDEYSPIGEKKPIKTVKDRNNAKLESYKNELRNNYEMRKEAYAKYNQKIAELQAEYDGKKDKYSKVAHDILRSIEKYTRLRDNNDAQYEKRINDLRSSIDNMNSDEFKRGEQRMTKHEEYWELVKNLVGDTSTWKDKKMGLYYKVNTLRRNLRDIVRDENGNRDIAKADVIYDELQGKYNHNEAELNRTATKIKKAFADMKINKYEDAYIQMLGEFRHNPETTLTEEVVTEYLNKHKDKIDEVKVDAAINNARALYDDLIKRVNVVLKNQGMKEIEYRKGYFPHFTEEKQSILAKLLNWKTKNNEIPTDIAGLTEMFNPERSWQSFNKQRKTDVTDYSFLRGLDMYVQGSLDWIYHIEDIQKRREFENYIRYVHSEQGIKDRIDAINNNETLSAEEVQEQISLVYKEAGNPLNNFVTDFRTQTNSLAGKKSSMDRGMEEMTNRKFYSTMTNLSNRVTANMVGGSVSSALTNFIPITQSWGQVSPISSLRAMGETIKSTFQDDGIIDKSDFLTNRLRKAENLYQTNWDKVSDKANLLMESIDSFTSQTVWRSKYFENISNGMSENEAIKNADQFAENVLAGRSRGNQPTLFDSKNPLIKTFTAFQLEVNNQYGYMFKDMPQDMRNETKTKLVKGYVAMFIGAYAYNALYSALTGRDTAFDPIGIIEELLKDLGFGDDDEEKEINIADTVMNFAENVLQEVPFVGGLLGGGRVPLSSALPYGGNIKEAFEGTVTDLAEGNLKHLFKEYLSSVGAYAIAPVGGGQIRKTIQGLSMYSDEHPIAGSYTDSGNLRFTAGNKWQDVLQSALFGQYSSKTARQYFDEGRTALNKQQIQELIDVDIPIQDYWKYRDGLAKQVTPEDKFNYINGLNLSDVQKNVLINNIVKRKENVDMSNYDDFENYEEFDFYTKNTDKYKFLAENGVSYKEYKANEDTKEEYDSIYSWYKNNPEEVTVAKSVANNVVEYKNTISEINNIEGEKDKNGNTILGTRKAKRREYIFSLNIDYGQQCLLYRRFYDSKDDKNTYNYDIIDYLNSRDDISYEEMVTILTELDMKVDSYGNVSW